MAVTHANVALICKVPGIGKKTAERLVIEMRDKWKHLSDTSASSFSSKGDKEHHIVVSDAISALVNLGYNPIQAQKAVRSAFSDGPSEPALSELITAALRAL
jgi:Holliday junction DNA helicase RuvA